jgi:hypothetical protein
LKEYQEWGTVEALGKLLDMKWTIEKQKQGMEIWANSETEAILIGECYNEKERKRTHHLAAIIVEALNKGENQDNKNREGWVCVHCGESTYDTDVEYLFSAIEHLGCALKAEAKAEGEVQKAIRLGNEVTDEEA